MSNDTETLTLTDFLLARIAEDEAVAHQASGILSGPAQFGHQLWVWGDQRLEVTKARVLAECAAKRVAVDWYLGDDEMVMGATIKAMAAVYADHSDYRVEWRR